jgi:serine/threonine protein kinase
MADLSGQYLGRYHILEPLGEGGMATVYRAYDTRLERQVAVKIIRQGAFPMETLGEVLKRFEREAKSLARLSHPNIVKVHDFGEYENSPFLVLEYLPGGTLKKVLGKPMPWREAVRLILPVARGVEYAHQHGVVHRDIKPANILITESGEPMLSDFGIAKILEGETSTALTGTGMAMGTPDYMAPEQWGGITSSKSDQYSLAVVLFELVAGRKPYIADTPAAVLIKQATEPLPHLTEFVPGLPEEVEWVLIKALAKDPAERYPGMGEFVRALEELLMVGVTTSSRTGTHRVEPRPLLSTTSPIAEPKVTREKPPPLQPVKDQELPPLQPSVKRRSFLFPAMGIGILLILVCGAMLYGGWRLIFANQSTQTASPALEVFASPTSQAVPAIIASKTLKVMSTLTSVPSPTIMPTMISDQPVGKIVFTCQVAGENHDQICLMNADGSNQRQLTHDTYENFYPSLAPDGKSIIFVSNATLYFEIYEMDLNGNAKQISDGLYDTFAPEISPDGKQIVFTRSDRNSAYSEIWLVNRDGSNAHALYAPDGQDALDPTWSPDGEQILFAIGKDQNTKHLFVINVDGTGLRQVSSVFTTRGRSDWSWDGLWIAGYSGESWKREIFIMHPDGSDLHQISSGGNVLAPSFSPDSQWIVFTGYIDLFGNDNGCEIYIMRLDGSKLTRLTNNAYCDYQPRWGP